MTGQDDIGYTDLLDQQGIPKYDLRVEILGTLDEASSVLGVARAMTPNERTESIILEIQYDLCWMMSELAATTEEARPDIHITVERVNWLVDLMEKLQTEMGVEPEFTTLGDNTSGSFVRHARAVVRRVERQMALLDHRDGLHNPRIITYLDRLSALLFILGHYEDLAGSIAAGNRKK